MHMILRSMPTWNQHHNRTHREVSIPISSFMVVNVVPFRLPHHEFADNAAHRHHSSQHVGEKACHLSDDCK